MYTYGPLPRALENVTENLMEFNRSFGVIRLNRVLNQDFADQHQHVIIRMLDTEKYQAIIRPQMFFLLTTAPF